MRRKQKEYEEARALREQGLSLKAISERLDCSKSSISVWVHDLKVTAKPNPNRSNASFFAQRRKFYRNVGKEKARNSPSQLFIAGCMLYWGEGDKDRNRLGISNSDPALLKLFLKFLFDCFGVKQTDIIITIYTYTTESSVEETENYWLNELSLSFENLRKTRINPLPKSSKSTKRGKLKHGVCHLRCKKSMGILQTIYGALQELSGSVHLKGDT